MPTGNVHDVRDRPLTQLLWGYLISDDSIGIEKTSQDGHMLYIGYPGYNYKGKTYNFHTQVIDLIDANGPDPPYLLRKIWVALIDEGQNSETIEEPETASKTPTNSIKNRGPKFGHIDSIYNDPQSPESKWGYIETEAAYRHPSNCQGFEHEFILFVSDKPDLAVGQRVVYSEIRVSADTGLIQFDRDILVGIV